MSAAWAIELEGHLGGFRQGFAYLTVGSRGADAPSGGLDTTPSAEDTIQFARNSDAFRASRLFRALAPDAFGGVESVIADLLDVRQAGLAPCYIYRPQSPTRGVKPKTLLALGVRGGIQWAPQIEADKALQFRRRRDAVAAARWLVARGALRRHTDRGIWTARARSDGSIVCRVVDGYEGQTPFAVSVPAEGFPETFRRGV